MAVQLMTLPVDVEGRPILPGTERVLVDFDSRRDRELPDSLTTSPASSVWGYTTESYRGDAVSGAGADLQSALTVPWTSASDSMSWLWLEAVIRFPRNGSAVGGPDEAFLRFRGGNSDQWLFYRHDGVIYNDQGDQISAAPWMYLTSRDATVTRRIGLLVIPALDYVAGTRDGRILNGAVFTGNAYGSLQPSVYQRNESGGSRFEILMMRVRAGSR